MASNQPFLFPTDGSQKPTIDDLKGKTEEEHKFSIIAFRLLNGMDIKDHWLQIAKLNTPRSKNDSAIFEVDYGLFLDGRPLGYIDVEEKVSWKFADWPYPRTNIALYPMLHWQQGRFTGNHTVKLQKFSEKPDTSFWVGVRTDWMAFQIVPARTIIEHGLRTHQGTRYSNLELPVIAVDNDLCFFCDDADDFTNYIINQLEEMGVFDD